MKAERYPRLTPLRALELLRHMERARHQLPPAPPGLELRDVHCRAIDALANHVRAALVGPRRKRRSA